MRARDGASCSSPARRTWSASPDPTTSPRSCSGGRRTRPRAPPSAGARRPLRRRRRLATRFGRSALLVSLSVGLRVGPTPHDSPARPLYLRAAHPVPTHERKTNHVANIKSQIKRIRTNLKAQERNKAVKSEVKTVVRADPRGDRRRRQGEGDRRPPRRDPQARQGREQGRHPQEPGREPQVGHREAGRCALTQPTSRSKAPHCVGAGPRSRRVASRAQIGRRRADGARLARARRSSTVPARPRGDDADEALEREHGVALGALHGGVRRGERLDRRAAGPRRSSRRGRGARDRPARARAERGCHVRAAAADPRDLRHRAHLHGEGGDHRHGVGAAVERVAQRDERLAVRPAIAASATSNALVSTRPP